MKLSLIKFIANYSERMTELLKGIETAENYEQAKARGNFALGYADALNTLADTLDDALDDKSGREPDETAKELEELACEWKYKIRSAVLMAAVKTCQPAEEIRWVAELRDEWAR